MRLKYWIIILVAAFLQSCSSDFLDEKPLDFIAADNAFETEADFDMAINNLYNKVRREFYSRDENYPMDYIYATDLVFDGEPRNQRRWSTVVQVMRPSGGANVPLTHWEDLYKIISDANVVITKVEPSNLSDEKKMLYEAKARFFRGFTYRILAYLYGGVPLTLEEVTEPKLDYVRATKEEVLAQCVEDLNFAATNLPGITEVRDGEVHSLVASHFLAEVYLAQGENKKAIDEATKVINDPNTGLMQNRFGSRSSETPGDVYWDLFRRNNQNRASGNTEGLWVIQFETDVDGGGAVSTNKNGSAVYERHHAPFVRDIRIDGEPVFSWPTGDYTGGRGIGWAISTHYFSNTIWESDFTNDMRNANHNFVRKFAYNRSSSGLFGDTLDVDNPPEGVTVPSRQIYAYQSKVTTPYNHPEGLYADASTYALRNTAGGTYTDQYMTRLSETYLLRAEAYLKDNQPGLAADDINVVRNRAHATPVAAGDVDIDYILDERMRELGIEEKRRLTLQRLGLLYDRVTRCNPYYETIEPHHNLWPIPFAEIERNSGAVLEQNPGYDNI